MISVQAPSAARWRLRPWMVGAATAALLVATLFIAVRLVNEPLRRYLEANLNASLEGYTVSLPAVELRPFSLALSLIDLSVRQNAHPDPPVVELSRMTAGVHWRALLALRLVADLHVASPRLHIDRRQVVAEADDALAVQDKGWQDAIESIYPLKFDAVRITDGALTYVDDPQRPLTLSQFELTASNIRNVRSDPGTFPSPFRVRAALFESGRLAVDGAADFLASPGPAVRADIELARVPLQRLGPVADDVALRLRGGVLAAAGEVESTHAGQHVRLRSATIDGLTIDYIHAPDTARAATQRAARLAEATVELANEPSLRLDIEALHLSNAALGVVDRSARPEYRVFFDRADIRLLNVSNQMASGRGWSMLDGRFMGSGRSELWASFVPDRQAPDVNVAVQIRDTDMRAMNDLFRARGDFDVVGGRFSFFSELYLTRGQIDGYIKPLFADVDVYDRRQDRGEGLGQQLYEGVVGGVAGLLENRNDQTATQARVTGNSNSPDLSAWEIAVNLVRNAFFRAIVPGLEHAAMGTRSATVVGTEPD